MRLMTKPSFWASCGEIGRLQTLDRFYVNAGEVVSMNVGKLITRFSPMRVPLLFGAQADICVFYVKHRHVYGNVEKEFHRKGVNESVTFPGCNMNAGSTSYTGDINHAYVDAYSQGDRSRLAAYSLGSSHAANILPLHMPEGLRRIWNGFYRVPTDYGTGQHDFTENINLKGYNANDWENWWLSDDGFMYGPRCAHLKTRWSTAVEDRVPDSSSDVEVSGISGTTGSVSIHDFARVKASYRTENQRQFLADKYEDVMREDYGVNINAEEEYRPTLLWRHKLNMGGYEVEKTDLDAGDAHTRGVDTHGFRVPGKYFPERGVIWTCILVRFPSIVADECHWFDKVVNPSYLEAAANADLLAAEPPHHIDMRNHFSGTSSVRDVGVVPYGEWYRTHTNRIHNQYKAYAANVKDDSGGGLPIIFTQPVTKADHWYVNPDRYEKMFLNRLLSHYSIAAGVMYGVKSKVPGRLFQIFGGIE